MCGVCGEQEQGYKPSTHTPEASQLARAPTQIHTRDTKERVASKSIVHSVSLVHDLLGHGRIGSDLDRQERGDEGSEGHQQYIASLQHKIDALKQQIKAGSALASSGRPLSQGDSQGSAETPLASSSLTVAFTARRTGVAQGLEVWDEGGGRRKSEEGEAKEKLQRALAPDKAAVDLPPTSRPASLIASADVMAKEYNLLTQRIRELQAQIAAMQAPKKRGGRPKGSKNKPKE